MTQIVVHHDVECRRVKKSEDESENKMEGCEISSNHGGSYRVGMKFIILVCFQIFWSHNSKKTASFSIQMVEFVFERSNFNLNETIRSCRIVTARRPSS
jgi:hypothetical protein